MSISNKTNKEIHFNLVMNSTKLVKKNTFLFGNELNGTNKAIHFYLVMNS